MTHTRLALSIAASLAWLAGAADAGPRVRSADAYDLNGDGKGDLVAVGATSVRVQLMNGTSVLATGFVGAAGHALVAVADFDGDGKDDLLLEGPEAYRIDFMDGLTRTGRIFVPRSGGTFCTAGDYGGDGDADLFLHFGVSIRITRMQDRASAGNAFHSARGSDYPCSFFDDGASRLVADGTTTGFYVVSPLDSIGSPSFLVGNGGGAFSVAAGADVDGDGDEDVFLNGPSTRIDRLGGTSASAPVYLNSGNGQWAVTALGDFDGDGKPDFASRAAVAIRVLLLDGTTPRETGFLPSGNGTFALRRADDFDGDWRSDLVSQSTVNGLIRIDLMNGVASVARGFVPGAGFTIFP